MGPSPGLSAGVIRNLPKTSEALLLRHNDAHPSTHCASHLWRTRCKIKIHFGFIIIKESNHAGIYDTISKCTVLQAGIQETMRSHTVKFKQPLSPTITVDYFDHIIPNWHVDFCTASMWMHVAPTASHDTLAAVASIVDCNSSLHEQYSDPLTDTMTSRSWI